MKFLNKHYGKKLIGRRVSVDLLKGRDFRPDTHRHFKQAEETENIWYKAFSVGLDKSCQEAYYILGLLLDDAGTIRQVSAGVMYMDSDIGGCMCSFATDEDSEADVDDIDNDKTEEDDEARVGGSMADEETGSDDDEDEDDDGEEDIPRPKHVMDILPLDGMLLDRTPYVMEHEAAMIVKGRWLPASFSPDDFPLPGHLVSRFITGTAKELDHAYPILNKISFELKREPDEDSFEGDFDILANRGTRYFVCHFDGGFVEGMWRINSIDVVSYASTGSGFGNLFNRPSSLSDNEHDYQQACLLLVDFCDDAEFVKLLK